MGFRFRKSIKLIPGVRLNLSKSGPSVSVGGGGFTTNYSSRGTRSTISIPGTGISYVTSQKRRPVLTGGTKPATRAFAWIVVVLFGGIIILAIFGR